MSLTALQKKLGINTNKKIIFINSPEGFTEYLEPLPEGAELKKQLKGSFDLIHFFAKKREEVDKVSGKLVKALNKEGYLWVAYPKKTSGIETDLNRDKCWDIFAEYKYRPVSMVSLNEKWSSIRFKPSDEVSKKYQKSQSTDEFKKYINKVNKTVKAPDDLSKHLNKNKKVNEFFESLAYTHKKEYVQWILEAKREETRQRRVTKTIEMLKNGMKNPYDK